MKLPVRSLTIIMGAFLALVIVFVQLFHFQLNHQPKKETKVEQHDKSQSKDEQVYFTPIGSFSLPSPAHIELDVESFCLFEVHGEESSDEKYALEIPHYTQKFLQTLFGVIISPNAP